MLSHSPLRMFTQLHKMRVLVSGQGPVEEVAHMYPLVRVLTLKTCVLCLLSAVLFMFNFAFSI